MHTTTQLAAQVMRSGAPAAKIAHAAAAVGFHDPDERHAESQGGTVANNKVVVVVPWVNFLVASCTRGRSVCMHNGDKSDTQEEQGQEREYDSARYHLIIPSHVPTG